MMTTRSATSFPTSENKMGVLFDLFSLTKPRLSSLVIFTSALGLFLAPGDISLAKMLVAILATSGLVAGACVINCCMEKDIDARMERTKNRPLPSGRLSSELALSFGLSLILVCLVSLAAVVNLLTAFLGLVAAVVYIAFYTPMKRKTSWALFAGAIPGAIPPLMGWTSVTGQTSLMGWALFAILFMWQLPHFLSISIYHVKDYSAAGIKTFPAELGMHATVHRILWSTVALWLVSLAPYFLGYATLSYLVLASIVGVSFSLLALGGFLVELNSPAFLRWSRLYFYGSLVYLPVIFLGMLVLQ